VTKQTGFLVAIRNGVISLAVLILFINGVASAQCAGLSIYGRQEAQSQDRFRPQRSRRLSRLRGGRYA